MSHRVRSTMTVMVAAACGATTLSPPPAVSAPADPAGSAAATAPGPLPAGWTGAVPSPRIDWRACPDAPQAQCGTVTVPVDWSRRGGPTVRIAVARRPATAPGRRIGTLLINPGGPGGSGVELVKNSGRLFSAAVHARFDTVGFDPRGAAGSSPVRCAALHPDPPLPEFPANWSQFTRLVAANRGYAAACRRLTGPVFDFLDTASGVHDLEAIRAALGEPRLSFYGVSYATLLGQQYAQRYPHRVRAMVLDSVMDHSLAGAQQFLRTAAHGAQESFDQFVAWCQREVSCALHTVPVRAEFARLYARAQRGELAQPGTGERISPLELLAVTHGAFYQPDWPFLAAFLAGLRAAPTATGAAGSGGLPVLPRPGADRWTGELVHDPVAAIFCQDWRLPVRDRVQLSGLLRDSARAAPDMRVSPLAWRVTLGCLGLSDRVRNPQHQLRPTGAPPILLLASRYDPATPYQWAHAVARRTGAVLLRYDGWGHYVYGKGSSCVVAATDRYLITGRPPVPGTHCPAVPAVSAQRQVPLPGLSDGSGRRPVRPGWHLLAGTTVPGLVPTGPALAAGSSPGWSAPAGPVVAGPVVAGPVVAGRVVGGPVGGPVVAGPVVGGPVAGGPVGGPWVGGPWGGGSVAGGRGAWPTG